MTHLHIENNDKTIPVRVAQIRDVLHIMDEVYQVQRKELLEDLESSGAGTLEKIQALAGLREERGSVSLLMKSAFSLHGAIQILKHLSDSSYHDSLNEVPMDQLVLVALKAIGFESDDETSGEEEGKA